MRASQNVFRIRRQYNKWVANETLEDYSLRFTARGHRRWSIDRVAKTALGSTSFLALEAIAATLTLSFGFENTFWAIMALALVIMITGLPICYQAAKHGLDIDLLTRSAGFGYLGSTITSLIYASFTFIFFAIEAAILASALKLLFGIPLWVGYILCAVAVIPIVTHGIAAISRFQVSTQWVWLSLQIAAISVACFYEYQEFHNWIAYRPDTLIEKNSIGFDLALFGAASAVMFALIAQIGEQVDYLRFLPEKNSENSRTWWFWMLLSGPGWIVIGIIKMLFGSFLAYLAISRGAPPEIAADPASMYQMVFTYLTNSPGVSLILAGILVIICQMKINVTNAYAGSLAWSNFFSRLTHSHPGRVVWLVFNVVIALILMELGIYRALESILGVFAIVAVSWLSCIAADLTFNTLLGLRPKHAEFKRAYLYDINPVGVVSMALATVIGIVSYLGYFGEDAKSLAHFISIAVCYMSVPTIAWITRGRYYIAREPEPIPGDSNELVCSICENRFEKPDMAACPVYQGVICSLCCSLDTRCMDSCKPHGRYRAQARDILSRVIPARILDTIDLRVSVFLSVFAVISFFTGLLLALIYYQMSPSAVNEQTMLQSALWSLYFILIIIFGVIAWLFLLTQESREIAQHESNNQTNRLIQEIEAHEVTDKELQSAKDLAEQANQAKSRYLTGISHELRTPLQSISGYAQLLSQQSGINEFQDKGLNTIRRNSEYLADLIEGLLNISKIEAGRLELNRNRINLKDLLNQLEQIFRPEAASKGIEFKLTQSANLPEYVIADEKRLRQILINLISNAVKYTNKGSVSIDIRYRNQVAEIKVRDTGVGIAADNLERIMKPFERVRTANVPDVSGTGLGLTIVRLLTEIMGGELSVQSELGVGSEFKVSLLLFETSIPDEKSTIVDGVTAYEGERKTILAVDDEAIHRGLISDLLQPLGFRVLEAPDAAMARTMLSPDIDLFLLDISMPNENGISLAKHIRKEYPKAPIIMLSADAEEQHLQGSSESKSYNAYIIKPMNNKALLVEITQQLNLNWVSQPSTKPSSAPLITKLETEVALEIATNKDTVAVPSELLPLLRELDAHLKIGHSKGIRNALDRLMESGWPSSDTLSTWHQLATTYRYTELAKKIKDRVGDEY